MRWRGGSHISGTPQWASAGGQLLHCYIWEEFGLGHLRSHLQKSSCCWHHAGKKLLNNFFSPMDIKIGQLWPADPRTGPQCTVSVSVAGWGGCNGV